MNIELYKRKREALFASQPTFRKICGHCRQPDFSCYCAWLAPFDPQMEFVILSHPIEYHRRIATGRMSHLSLKNSRLIEGEDYSGNCELNEMLNDKRLYPVMLYPGRNSQNLTYMSEVGRFELLPSDKKLMVIVIDGTWATARKMVRLSENIKHLPRICFSPPTPSNFRVRRQPNQECYSTIEAIHHTIELMGSACGFHVKGRKHDALLDVFDKMINRQLELAHCGKPRN
jgi:DTW domain-containing protein YfiP